MKAVYKGYDAYHSQIRKLDWLKAHRALTTSPEVTPHTTWLIETLHAIITRWEAVLPADASPGRRLAILYATVRALANLREQLDLGIPADGPYKPDHYRY